MVVPLRCNKSKSKLIANRLEPCHMYQNSDLRGRLTRHHLSRQLRVQIPPAQCLACQLPIVGISSDMPGDAPHREWRGGKCAAVARRLGLAHPLLDTGQAEGRLRPHNLPPAVQFLLCLPDVMSCAVPKQADCSMHMFPSGSLVPAKLQVSDQVCHIFCMQDAAGFPEGLPAVRAQVACDQMSPCSVVLQCRISAHCSGISVGFSGCC